MLDASIRPYINPVLNQLGLKLAKHGVSPNALTLVGFGLGVSSIYFLAHQLYIVGLILILINRLFDGLDGAVARATRLSNMGGFLDIVCDFIFYAAVIFGFALAQPENAIWAAFLIFSYIGPTSTFLAYAILAEKHNIRSDRRGQKSLYYLGGLCEGTETIIAMVLLCLFPQAMPYICGIYGLMCWVTSFSRTYEAYQDFANR